MGIMMRSPDKGNESSIVGAVSNLERNDIHWLMLQNAQQVGYRLNDEHFEVIDTLIEHCRRVGRKSDYQCSSREIRFLSKKFQNRGGSRYLYRLFNKEEGSCDVLPVIRSLIAVPASGCEDCGDIYRPPAAEKPVCPTAGKRVRRARVLGNNA